MKKFLIGFFGLITQVTHAQQDQLEVSEGANAGDWNIDWDGVAGRFYTLECSTDLVTWQYMPAIKYGTGAHIFGFSSSAPKTFIRLHYMDVATSNPLGGDIDGDGLTNQQEVYTYGTNPFVSDIDGDGIDDLYEVNNTALDPLFAGDALLDPDGDNLVNLWEYKLGLNLAVANTDTDGDGLVDALENFLGSQFSSILSDTDSDGIDDDLEDPDSDEISTLMEFGVYGTNGLLFDTDDDGMNDKWEIVRGFNPLIFVMAFGVAENPNADPDGDGLTNQEESEYGTDPNNNDTDNDGVNDSDEIDQGSNPLDSDDDAPPPKGTTPINIRFGDPGSSSGSEKYKLFLYPLEGDPNGIPRRLRSNQKYGLPRNVTFNLPKGSKYKVVLEHYKTNHPSGSPDFDYEIELLSPCSTLEEDQGGMAGNHYHPGFTGSFDAAGKSCTLYVPLFEWITPKESPVTMPNDGLPAGTPGQNEFTYDTASPGVLTIGLEMLVKPTGTAQSVNYDGTKFSDRCFFSLPDPIVGSTFAWDNAHPGGKSSPSGEMVVALSTYTNLPLLNSEFGLKVAEMTCDGMVPSEIDPLGAPGQEEFGEFEVFFPKSKENHPGIGSGVTPNWYFYWAGTAVPGYDITSGTYVYAVGSNANDYAEYNGNHANPTYTIHGPASAGHELYSSAGLNVDRKGIDTLACTLLHEKTHRQVDKNWLSGGIWHGKADTDSDELPDDWEDANSATGYVKTNRWSFTGFPYGDDEEVYCEYAAYGTTGDATKDWANPGKQSKNKF